jgi:methionyl-tRNA formyltransferase
VSASAVVFGYGDVGVRCLKTLLSAGLDVRLVVTHEDDPAETRWYDSVADTAADCALPLITPATPANIDVAAQIAAVSPDFVFSFFYRFMLPQSILDCAHRAALNMHGSLLPRFRGRAPVNWALVRGATTTGATLHHMTEKADAGDIVDQLEVPILNEDDGLAVFRKVATASEIVLARSLPALLANSAPRIVQDLTRGEYCGRRRPEDGRIDWLQPAQTIHNLVRAVAPPFPGAFATIEGERWTLIRTRLLTAPPAPPGPATLTTADKQLIITCADGQRLRILAASNAQGAIDIQACAQRLRGQTPVLA